METRQIFFEDSSLKIPLTLPCRLFSMARIVSGKESGFPSAGYPELDVFLTV
jgi:hypothetical protein